jgi:acyl-CoA synthetase (AMP-forming)/AMP-acid ligase II
MRPAVRSTGIAAWGEQIAVEVVNGVPYRMYTDRPRRLEELLSLAERWENRSHIIQGERIVSFVDMQHAVSAKAHELAAMGVQPGDRIFLLGWNGPEWVVNFWACVRAAAVPVLANAWWSAPEVASGLALTRPVLTLADAPAARKMPEDARLGPWAIDTTPGQNTEAAVKDSPNEEDTAAIVFTSGTSGQAKAVMLSHRAMLARLQMTLHVTRKLPQQVDESARDVTLLTGPLFHVGGVQTLLRALVVGDTIVLTRSKYDPKDVLESIEREKVTRWNAVPTMVSRLLDHPDLSRRDVSSLKSISIGGAPVHKELMKRIREGLPSVSPRIPTGYGLTENGGQATGSAGSESLDLLGSTGRPMPCVEVRFLPHPGLPDGEVLLRSPTQMSGYFGGDESPIDEAGWLHTGDLGRLDEKGDLWITGRCKDMIIRGGENIAPAAVERALMSIPGVADAAVFGVPHADLGEEVMAVVVVAGEDLTPASLQERLRGGVASFAVPSRWRIQREPLPTNSAGKVDKALMSAQVRTEVAQARAQAGSERGLETRA